MTGNVDPSNRALLNFYIRPSKGGESNELTVWIDTAFDGDLALSRSEIQRLGLKRISAVEAILADGTSVVLETYRCWLDWFGEVRKAEVVANDGRFPLLGTGLLRGRRLLIDYRTAELQLD